MRIAIIALLAACTAMGCADDAEPGAPGSMPLSSCRQTSAVGGVDVYCCDCATPVTKTNVTAVNTAGQCVIFCDGCVAEGFERVRGCPGGVDGGTQSE